MQLLVTVGSVNKVSSLQFYHIWLPIMPNRRAKCGLSYHSLAHALSLSVSYPHPHTHTHTHTHAAAEVTTITKQFSNFCNLGKLDQNSSMLSVMTMEHDTENIKLVPAPLSFWFPHYLCTRLNSLPKIYFGEIWDFHNRNYEPSCILGCPAVWCKHTDVSFTLMQW